MKVLQQLSTREQNCKTRAQRRPKSFQPQAGSLQRPRLQMRPVSLSEQPLQSDQRLHSSIWIHYSFSSASVSAYFTDHHSLLCSKAVRIDTEQSERYVWVTEWHREHERTRRSSCGGSGTKRRLHDLDGDRSCCCSVTFSEEGHVHPFAIICLRSFWKFCCF